MIYKAYTQNLGYQPDSIVTDVLVSFPLAADAAVMRGYTARCKAKWDTGCNMTCITEKLRRHLGLPIVGSIGITNPHGLASITHTTRLSMKLPNGQILPNNEVCVANMPETDILIGFDIISKGDFAISRNDFGQVIFSFCMPNVKKIDFEQIAHEVNQSI